MPMFSNLGKLLSQIETNQWLGMLIPCFGSLPGEQGEQGSLWKGLESD